jgi:putative membrane protein
MEDAVLLEFERQEQTIKNKNAEAINLYIMKFLVEILLLGVAVSVVAYLIPGVWVDGFWSAIVAGLLIAIANATIGTLLRVLTFPINLITLGLMSFIITVLMVLLVDSLLTGFETTGFLEALIFALLLSVIKMVFNSLQRG